MAAPSGEHAPPWVVVPAALEVERRALFVEARRLPQIRGVLEGRRKGVDVDSRDRGAVVVWAVAPLFAAAILLGVLFFFAHRAGRRAVNDLDFKLEHPPTAAVQVVAPPPAADVELVAP